jgi:small-conductance mechanosensitive channel
VQIADNSGDIIDIGFFYTRLLEIGNWIHGDQYSGRILQFPNAQIFGAGVFNYTRDFQYIWDEVALNVTYDSNLDAATRIMLDAGNRYTHDFMSGAEQQLHRMQQYFLVPDFELKPQVYLHVTTNWVGLSMRYVVDPKKRRSAASFLYSKIFDEVRKRDDIQIGTDTMEITYKKAKEEDRQSHPEDHQMERTMQEQSEANYDEQNIPGQIPGKDNDKAA